MRAIARRSIRMRLRRLPPISEAPQNRRPRIASFEKSEAPRARVRRKRGSMELHAQPVVRDGGLEQSVLKPRPRQATLGVFRRDGRACRNCFRHTSGMRETTRPARGGGGVCGSGLFPGRRELLEFAVHRSPRRRHRVGTWGKPFERRDQPPHPHQRRAPSNPIHVHFWIRDVNQPLCIHEIPTWGHRPGNPPRHRPSSEGAKVAIVMPQHKRLSYIFNYHP